MTNLWKSFSSHRVFGWKQILGEWKYSTNTPYVVECVLENLRAALNPSSTYSPRVSQFLTFLNNEQEGISWFLFECITLRWLWGDIHLDFVRELVDEIDDLDGHFSDFPGSPNCTIRKFVTDNLSADELDYIQMMPPLAEEETVEEKEHEQFITPPRVQRRAACAPAVQVPSVSASASRVTEPSTCIMIRLIRDTDEKKDDDAIYIKRNSISNLFEIRYKDPQSKLNMNVYSVTSDVVIRHMKLFLRMLTVDEEPFKSIQFSLPCLPTIVVTPKNLTSQTRDLIYDSMEMTMENWPVVY
jgi:hypothetical protein